MGQIYCSNCGQLISTNSNFCKFCGAAQHGPDAKVYRALANVAISPEAARDSAKKNKTRIDLFAKQTLGVDALTYFFLKYILKTSFILLGLLIGSFFNPLFAISAIFYFVLIFVGAFLTYNNFTFEIDKSGLKIESGVIHKNHVSLPFEQVQNVNIERSLTDRILGISRLSIETAGAVAGSNYASAQAGNKLRAEAFLPGLKLEKAKKIHDLLIDGSDGILGND